MIEAARLRRAPSGTGEDEPTRWLKIKNPDSSQAGDRAELFHRWARPGVRTQFTPGASGRAPCGCRSREKYRRQLQSSMGPGGAGSEMTRLDEDAVGPLCTLRTLHRAAHAPFISHSDIFATEVRGFFDDH